MTVLKDHEIQEIYGIANDLRIAIIDKLAEKENLYYLQQLKLLEKYIAYEQPENILLLINDMQKHKDNMEQKRIISEGYYHAKKE